MNLNEIRTKYPQYNDLSDDELAQGFHSKFYSDIPFPVFANRIGVPGYTESISALTPEREQADKGFIRKGMEAIAGTVRIPVEPRQSMREEEKARATIELAAKDAGIPVGEYRTGPGMLEQAAAEFTDAALLGIPGAIRRAAVGGEGLAQRPTTPEEKIGAGVGTLAGMVSGAPMGAIAPVSKVATPIARTILTPGYSQIAKVSPELANVAFRALPWWKKAAPGMMAQAPALAAGTAAMGVGRALEEPTIGKAAEKVGEAAAEGATTGAIFGAAGEIPNRIARIATGMALLEAQKLQGTKPPGMEGEDKSIQERAFDFAQNLFFLWSKHGGKAVNVAEKYVNNRIEGKKPPIIPEIVWENEGAKAIPWQDFVMGSRYIPPKMIGEHSALQNPPTLALPEAESFTMAGSHDAFDPLTAQRLKTVMDATRKALPAPPGYGEGFSFKDVPPEPKQVGPKFPPRPAELSAAVFQKELDKVQSPQGMELLKKRLSDEESASRIVTPEQRQQLIDKEFPPEVDIPPLIRTKDAMEYGDRIRGTAEEPAVRSELQRRIAELRSEQAEFMKRPSKDKTGYDENIEKSFQVQAYEDAIDGLDGKLPALQESARRINQELRQKAQAEQPRPMQPMTPTDVQPPDVGIMAPFPKQRKPRPPVEATTLLGAIRQMGGINKGNFKGELKEVPLKLKMQLKASGRGIDLAEIQLKEEGWLLPDENLIDVLREPKNLSRNKVAGDGVQKRPQDMNKQELQFERESNWEPEEPPKGEYVQMMAEDLPVGKELTIIDGRSRDGWDKYKVTEKDPFGVTLQDGETIKLGPFDLVEARREDISEQPNPPLILQGEKATPKPIAEMRSRGRKVKAADQPPLEFAPEKTPEVLELQGEKATSQDAAAFKESAKPQWKEKTNKKEGKTYHTYGRDGTVSGDESTGYYAFDNKGQIIGEGEIVEPFKTVAEAKKAVEDHGTTSEIADRVSRLMQDESGQLNIDFGAIKAGIKNMRANIKDEDIGLVRQAFGLPKWVAKEYPKEAGPIQEVIDNRLRMKHRIKNDYHKELLDSWEGLSKQDIEVVGKSLWKGDELGQVLSDAGRKKLTPKQLEAYDRTREVLEYIWYEDRPELMKEMGLNDNEIREYYATTGHKIGYMPHPREGRYAVTAKDPNTKETVYRKDFDDFLLTLTGKRFGAKQALIKQKVEQDFPGMLIDVKAKKKVLAESAYREVSPQATQELIEASMRYLNATDAQKAELGQAMKKAVADVFKVRGFGEHFMKRKDIPGFDKSNWQDAVLNYTSAWAGYKSKLVAAKQMWGAWGKVDWSGKENLRNFMSDQVKDTFANETFADRAVDNARGILFRQYLSGVPKSAIVNLTQSYIATIPRLTIDTKWADAKVHAEMMRAAGDVLSAIKTPAQPGMSRRETAQAGRLEPEIVRGLRAAREDGTIASQTTDELIGRRAGKFGSKIRSVDNALGWMFRTAEVFNREIAFVTAMRIAKNEKGMSYEDAYKYARGIVEETQGVYGKTNLPPFARGDSNWNKAGRAGYAFRHYSNNLFNLWSSMLKEGPRGALALSKSLAAIATFGGISSMPFIDTFLAAYNKMTGNDGKTELAQSTGDLAETVLYGAPGGVAGVDISGSLGTDVPTSVTDILGPMADWGKRAMLTKESFQAGDYQRVAEDFPLMPAAIRNVMAGSRLATRGLEKRSGKDVKDESGKPIVIDTKAAVKKAAGFQPTEVSETYRREQATKNITGYWNDRADIIRKKMRLAFDNGVNSDEYKNALKDMNEYNAEAPAYIPKINPKNVIVDKPTKKETLLKKSVK